MNNHDAKTIAMLGDFTAHDLRALFAAEWIAFSPRHDVEHLRALARDHYLRGTLDGAAIAAAWEGQQ